MSDPSGPDRARTLMWEAKAAEGRADELLAWLVDVAPLGEVFRSFDRVVLVVDLASSDGVRAEAVPQPPPDLVARPPHAWRFTRVR
jgi:hypothetical protein